MEKIPTKDFREARTAWQAVNSVGKPLPPAKSISMSLRYAHTAWRPLTPSAAQLPSAKGISMSLRDAHTAWRAFNSVGSLAAARQPRRGPETAAGGAKILIANARLEFRANH
jgi:hypothetical protein